MTMNNRINDDLMAWHRQLLGEAQTISYRLRPDVEVTKVFYDDLAFMLERLAESVRNRQRELYPDT